MARKVRAQLTLSVALLCACGSCGGDSGPIAPPAPQQVLTKVSGDSQSGRVGPPVLRPLVVRLATPADTPVTGATIRFEIIAGTGTLESATATTDVDGRAEARLTFGREIGAVAVRARSPTNAEVTFTATPQTSFPVIYAGTSHTCARASPAGTYCWGANDGGQVGDGTTTSRRYPRAVGVEGDISFTLIAAGSVHTCAVRGIGTSYCWGLNASGNLGDGTITQKLTPVAVASPGGVSYTSIDVGRDHSCARVANGGVHCWGSNASLQLGDGTSFTRTTPRAVVQPDGVVLNSVATGDVHTCAISTAWLLYCWGEDISGATSHTPSHVAMPDGTTVVGVDAGGRHTCARTLIPTMYCWGANDRGQLGIGNTTNQRQPTAVSLPSGVDISELRLGDRHSCFRTSAGVVYCWGANDKGQLGDGSTADRTTPVLVRLPPGLTATNLAVGGNHTCVTTSDGAYCWGSNASGQLGDDSNTDRVLPVRVRTQ